MRPNGMLGNRSVAIGVIAVTTLLLSACARALGPGASTSSPPTPTPSESPLPIPTGIQQEMPPPASGEDFTMTNEWQGFDGQGRLVQVWAGASAAEPVQGELVEFISAFEPDGVSMDLVEGHTFDTPSQDGAVTITGAEGTTLTLTAEDGTTLIFDWQLQTFGQGSPTPTMTPTATPS